ncbi:MAG: hypothetical protein HOW73_33470 [Polyangiaceae bacterium]|nr:hypothetical protein [Polyangiaceae bacterium]
MRLIGLRIALTVAALLATTSALAEEPSSDVVTVDPDLDAPSPTKPMLMVRASAGATTRALFDSMVVGGELDVGAGIDTASGSYALGVSAFAGVVEGGLFCMHAALGIDLAWPIGIVRIGVRPRVGYIGIDRVTTERQFGAYTFGLAGRVTVDVFRDQGFAFALGAEPTADVAAALGNDGESGDGAAPFVGGRAFLEVRIRPSRD